MTSAVATRPSYPWGYIPANQPKVPPEQDLSDPAARALLVLVTEKPGILRAEARERLACSFPRLDALVDRAGVVARFGQLFPPKPPPVRPSPPPTLTPLVGRKVQAHVGDVAVGSTAGPEQAPPAPTPTVVANTPRPEVSPLEKAGDAPAEVLPLPEVSLEVAVPESPSAATGLREEAAVGAPRKPGKPGKAPKAPTTAKAARKRPPTPKRRATPWFAQGAGANTRERGAARDAAILAELVAAGPDGLPWKALCKTRCRCTVWKSIGRLGDKVVVLGETLHRHAWAAQFAPDVHPREAFVRARLEANGRVTATEIRDALGLWRGGAVWLFRRMGLRLVRQGQGNAWWEAPEVPDV